MKLARRHYDLLGRAFDAEISNRLPMQTKSVAILADLHEIGLLAPMERRQSTPLGALVVRGWKLTHAGMLAYCEWADAQGEAVRKAVGG